MDDPWANAWGEPANKAAHDAPATWSHTSKPSTASDAEADIAMPSWATGAGVQWSEPSTDQTTLWHPSMPLKEWGTSPYEDLPLGKPSPDPIPDPDRSTSPEAIETAPSSPASKHASLEKALEELPSTDNVVQSITRSSTPTSTPGSPDAFGTFETGLDVDETDVDPWAKSLTSPEIPEEAAEVWVPSWGASDRDIDAQTLEKADEWEAAKQSKAKQDQHVPPHILAAILDEFQTLSSELWPATGSPSEQTGVSEQRSGMDEVEGLAAVADRIIPQDLTLPPYVQFSKTFTAKNTGESLRLTRHVPITRLSPFNLYLASKGSTAWETSVKARPEIPNDDFLPPGWRVVEKDKEESVSAVDTKKKSTGGLLSFFGRKAPTTSPDNSPRRSESPSRASLPTSIGTTAASKTGTSSPVVGSSRTSVDGVGSVPVRGSTPGAIVPTSSSGDIAASDSGTALAHPTLQPLPPSPDVFEPVQVQAPSAVSRFLGRFSRSKASGSNPRNSLALSTDDLEFLSDIIPSANDEADEDSQLRELSSMISSSPLSTVLPPPLAPPPKVPPPPKPTRRSLPGPSEGPPPPPSTDDDLFSLFNSPPTSVPPPAVPSLSTTFAQPLATIASLPLPSQPPFMLEPQITGTSSSSSRGIGHSSSPFDLSTLKPSTPLPRRAPVAIMSSGSAASSSSSFHILPPPPILPPPAPMTSEKSSSQSQPASIGNMINDAPDFADFYSPPPTQPSLPSNTSLTSNRSLSTTFSDKSLFSGDSSSQNLTFNTNQAEENFFDDFDDFVFSPIRDPSPPRPPAKPTPTTFPASFGHRPLVPPVQQQQVPIPPQPPVKHPSPPPTPMSTTANRTGPRAANHQRTMSLMIDAAARPGVWPAPLSPVPQPIPAPDAPPSHSRLTSGMQPLPPPSVQVQSSSNPASQSQSQPSFPFALPPPPGFSSPRTATLPHLSRAASPSVSGIQNGNGIPFSQPPLLLKTKLALAPPSESASVASGGLSAQDLSFFEGL
ncbi:hypothetical protein DXG03_007832 [Asterophora parasitica]|uniref:Uncharacterized protein n=1 Tax=Asterophora parasitica TaxID=117018 RepID=A0A9P7KEV5_9AGAR|nr:hypothetical protein DXG03_007832 [Asterophora parasitica]